MTSIEGRNNNVNAALCDGCSRVSGAAIDVAIPNDANYLFIAVSDSDGVVYLPSVSIDTLQEDAPSYEQIRASVKIKSVPSVKKIPFTVSVNINTAIDESDTTSLADTAVMSDDYCVLDITNSLFSTKPCIP